MQTEIATVAAGCFWCLDAVYRRVPGVVSVASGYAGGDIPNPTYEHVVTGSSGHAETVQVEFDPEKVTYQEILRIFFKMHNPTTLNRQGADVGTQYRSAIFYHNMQQQKIAAETIQEQQQYWDNPIVTEVTPLQAFYPAEDYHQDYYNKNPQAGYCQIVINPKLSKLAKMQYENAS